MAGLGVGRLRGLICTPVSNSECAHYLRHSDSPQNSTLLEVYNSKLKRTLYVTLQMAGEGKRFAQGNVGREQ